MFKIFIWLPGKARVVSLLFGMLCAQAAGVANGITYTYTEIHSSCDTLTVTSAGVVTCNCIEPFTTDVTGQRSICATGGDAAFHYNFNSQLTGDSACAAGLDINATTGAVACATTLPSCTISSDKPGSVVPGTAVTLTAACNPVATTYAWSDAGCATDSGSCTTTVTEATTYKMTGSNSEGAGNAATLLVGISLPACTLTTAQSSTSTGQTTLTAACSPTATTYEWSDAGCSATENTCEILTPDIASYYTVKGVNAGGTGSSSDPVKVVGSSLWGPYVYVPDNTGNVSVIDAAANTKAATPINVGAYPVGVAVHPAGTKVYVTNQGHNTVSVIDVTKNAVTLVDVAPGGQGPTGVAVTPDGKKLYVANNRTHNVSVIDTEDYAATPKTINVGQYPVGIAISPDGKKAYVSNSGIDKEGNSVTSNDRYDTVSVIDVEAGAEVGKVPTDRGPYGVVVSSDGSRVYVSNSTSGSFTVINTADYAPSGYPLGADNRQPQGIAVKPDGSELYVANTGSGTVSVVSAADPSTIYNLTGFNLPYGVSFNQSGSLAYVTNTGSKTVSIIDTATRVVVDTIAVDGYPYALGQFVAPRVNPYKGLWYNKDESGWGMSIAQHDSMNFVALYTYDQTGQPTWYVMSSCPITTAAGSCTGDIYRVTGGSLPTATWAPSLTVATAGSGTLIFSDTNNGTFDFTIDGLTGTKTIERQLFSAGTPAQAVDYTDLWWNANESGWGVALTQDKGMIFAAWYAYDAAGQPVWYVASSCPLSGSSCTGDIYRVTGGTALTSAWNATVAATSVGTVTFAFEDSGSGTMSYTIDGVAGSKAITRQSF